MIGAVTAVPLNHRGLPLTSASRCASSVQGFIGNSSYCDNCGARQILVLIRAVERLIFLIALLTALLILMHN